MIKRANEYKGIIFLIDRVFGVTIKQYTLVYYPNSISVKLYILLQHFIEYKYWNLYLYTGNKKCQLCHSRRTKMILELI